MKLINKLNKFKNYRYALVASLLVNFFLLIRSLFYFFNYLSQNNNFGGVWELVEGFIWTILFTNIVNLHYLLILPIIVTLGIMLLSFVLKIIATKNIFKLSLFNVLWSIPLSFIVFIVWNLIVLFFSFSILVFINVFI